MKAQTSVANGPLLCLTIVGGGASGCELALSIHARLTHEFQKHNLSPSSVQITLVHKGSDIMPQHHRGVKKIITRLLIERGIILHLNTNIVSVRESSTSNSLQDNKNILICEDGKEIYYDEAIWCTQVTFI